MNRISESDIHRVHNDSGIAVGTGQSVLRVEDPDLLCGKSTFVANLDLDQCLSAHYVTSIEAHANIEVDIRRALAMPGVVGVLSASDLSADFNTYPLLAGGQRKILADRQVRFVGEPIAVVVAQTQAQAADAAEMVDVVYEQLPAVIGGSKAAQIEDNIVLQATGPGENPSKPTFEDCEVVVEATIEVQRIAPCPLETRVAASLWTEDGKLVHYAACQGAHPIRDALAAHYQAQVQVITADVGGSFGAKARLYPEEILLPELARRVGKPVRWVPTRMADMAALGHSRAQTQTVKLGGDSNGTLRALDVHLVADLGAYPMTGGGLARNTAMILPGPYTTINQIHWEITAVVTNTTPIAAYRGAGRPEAASLLDRAVNIFAAKIGMDQAEIRRRNLMPPQDVGYTNPAGLQYESGNYGEALEVLLEELDYSALKAEQAQRRAHDSQTLLGVGIATFIDRTAGIPNPEYGAVELRRGGGFKVLTGSSPYGQGHHTTWIQLVSERTGAPPSAIEVIHGDTDLVPRGGITGGSRSAQRAGTAIVEATNELVAKAMAAAAQRLEASVGDVELDTERGLFHVAGVPAAPTITWAELANDLADLGSSLKCESDFLGNATVPYGAYGAVVEVDVETGAVRLDRLVTVDDAGTVINPMIVFGQVHGAVAQGIGQALHEEFVYDDAGTPLSSSFMDYSFASAAELCSFETHLTQNPTSNNPIGAKGVAESGAIGAVPAVQNAVVDAVAHLGIVHIDTPLTPQRVWTTVCGLASKGA